MATVQMHDGGLDQALAGCTPHPYPSLVQVLSPSFEDLLFFQTHRSPPSVLQSRING